MAQMCVVGHTGGIGTLFSKKKKKLLMPRLFIFLSAYGTPSQEVYVML